MDWPYTVDAYLMHIWCMFDACLMHVWCMFDACLMHSWYIFPTENFVRSLYLYNFLLHSKRIGGSSDKDDAGLCLNKDESERFSNLVGGHTQLRNLLNSDNGYFHVFIIIPTNCSNNFNTLVRVKYNLEPYRKNVLLSPILQIWAENMFRSAQK